MCALKAKASKTAEAKLWSSMVEGNLKEAFEAAEAGDDVELILEEVRSIVKAQLHPLFIEHLKGRQQAAAAAVH